MTKGLRTWSASGRATANGRDEGFPTLLFDYSPEAHGHGTTIHTYPTLGESIGMAAKVGYGSCTDLQPAKKQVPLGRRPVPQTLVNQASASLTQ